MKKLINKEEIFGCIKTMLIGISLIIFTYWFAMYNQMSFQELSRDTAAVLNGNVFVGAFSKVGITLWGISAIVLFMGWYYNSIYNATFVGGKIALYFSLWSAILYLDDFFMLHEGVLEEYLGLPQITLTVCYTCAVIYLSIKYRSNIFHNGLIYLILSFGLLGLSAVVDTLLDSFHGLIVIPKSTFVEDSFKFLGICFWLKFSVQFTKYVFKERLNKVA